jgi:hypothetical protein
VGVLVSSVGGVGERVMVMSMATREMGCGGGLLKEEGLGVKPTSAGRLVLPSICVSSETEFGEWTMLARGRIFLQTY